ncbi:serine protease snake [Cephus cinctus]|uniref:chymotrypsin n=1 Tax=Cephus cinctus TaxID=211228 RepID=A0AAJ7RKH2_CEPCN|nr:serine protease snake [Cephus cinctus]
MRLIIVTLFLASSTVPVAFCSSGYKSKEKCKEYANLVYENEYIPVLRKGAGSNRVSRCAIVETPLIIGGVKAKSMEFPHTAVIGFGTNDRDVSWQCGGTIISENYILTAAHCMESRDKGPARLVRVGLINLKDPGHAMQERRVVERIKHPNYRMPSRYHDIALLKLAKPIYLNSQVRPACLEIDFMINGRKAIASGFGKTSYDGSEGSNELMKVQLDYISQEECEKGFRAELGTRQMPSGVIPNLLCAGVMEGGKDTCQGDSGGPLQRVLTEPYCMYSVVGITSFGKFCGFKNSPAIYSRVSTYIDWIESIVWP